MLAASQIFDGLFVNYNTVILYITVSRYYKSNIFIKPFGTMLSFHNSQELKDRLLDMLYKERWGTVKVYPYVNSLYEDYGIPEDFGSLAINIYTLLDGFQFADFNIRLFEQIAPGKNLKTVPLRFIRAILAPSQLVMPNLEPSETLYYFECRQKIQKQLLALARMCDKVIKGELVPSEEIEAVKDYFKQYEDDPFCVTGLVCCKILESYNKENPVFNDQQLCKSWEQILSNCAYIWEQFGVKNSALWFRNLLFSLVR